MANYQAIYNKENAVHDDLPEMKSNIKAAFDAQNHVSVANC